MIDQSHDLVVKELGTCLGELVTQVDDDEEGICPQYALLLRLRKTSVVYTGEL